MELKRINSQAEFDLISIKISDTIEKYLLENTIVNCDLELKKHKIGNQVIIEFNNVKFLKQIKFKINHVEIKKLTFSLCDFREKLSFKNFYFKEVKIVDTIFQKDVDFSNSRFNHVDFKHCEFFSNLNFMNCRFNNISHFKNNFFYDVVDFSDSFFEGKVDFSDTSFRNGVNFIDVIFMNKFLGKNITSYRSKVDFSRVTFQKTSFLTESYFGGGVSLYGIIIKEFLDLTGIEVHGNNTDFETFRILKNFFIKQNNRIQVLRFYEKEMESYRKELSEKYFSTKKQLKKFKHHFNNIKPSNSVTFSNTKVHDEIYLKSLLKQEYKEHRKNYLRDKWILTFNKLSNNYGLSWVQGLKFILLSSVGFYFLYVNSLILQGNYPYTYGWQNWDEFWKATDFTLKYYLQFLIPTHKFNFMEGVKTSFLSHFIDFISRIIIGYGIYQMVQAFRKFGKI